jgi:NAD(P)-dependent dehydrogenase (short-subunit alcohol dehydrogenase family)
MVEYYRKYGMEDPREEGSVGKEFIPAMRMGADADFVGVALWLCSRAGAYVSGDVIVADGGTLSVTTSTY